MSLVDTLKTMIIAGDLAGAPKITAEALEAGTDPQEIVDNGLIAAMTIVGDRFAEGNLFVPEMMLSARVVDSTLKVLRPVLVEKGIKPKAVVVFGTVQGDVHDIGKNLVIMMMQGAGFEVHDLGVDVPQEKFYEAVSLRKPDLLCMSALLSTTQRAMGKTIQFLNDRGVRPSVKIMVGGAVITESFASQIGADAYAADAGSAVDRAKRLLGQN